MADLIEDTVTDADGVAVAGANVYVYADGVLAALTNSLGVAVSNPIVTNSLGFFSAYVTFTIEYRLDYYWLGRVRKQIIHRNDAGLAALLPSGWQTPANLANKFLGFDTNGLPIAVPEGGVASLLRANLLASAGSSLVGFIQSGTGAVVRTVRDKLRENVSVEDFGAVGDGVTDDTAAINAASAALVAVGGGTINFTRGKIYRANTIIYTRSNLTWNWNGAVHACNKQIVAFAPVFPTTTIGYVANNVVGPTNQLTLTSVTGLAVGNDVLIRLGYNPYDNAEPLWATTATVLAIAGLVITVDCLIPAITMTAYNYIQQSGASIAVPAVPANNTFRGVMLAPEGSRLVINNFTFLGDLPGGQSCEGAAYFQVGHNIVFNRPQANVAGDGDCGAGLVVGQYLRNVTISDAYIGCNKNGRGQASLGRAFNFSNCINVLIDNPVVRALESNFIFVESFSENIVVRNPVIEIPATARASTALFFALQGSDLRVENPSITSLHDNQILMNDAGGSDSNYDQTGVVKWRGALPLDFGPLKNCLLDYRNTAAASFTGQIAANVLTVTGWSGTEITLGALIRGGAANIKIVSLGTGTGYNGTYNVTATANIGPIAMQTEEFCVVEFRNAKTSSALVPLAASMYESQNLGGPYFNTTLFASSTAVMANATVYLGYDATNGNDLSASFTAGQERRYTARDLFGGLSGGLRKLAGYGFVLVSHTATAPAGGSYIGVKASSARVLRTSFTGGAATDLVGVALPDYYSEAALTGKKRTVLDVPMLVAALPAAAAVNKGWRATVTDATAPAFGAAVAGGGAVMTTVFSTGAAWNVG